MEIKVLSGKNVVKVRCVKCYERFFLISAKELSPDAINIWKRMESMDHSLECTGLKMEKRFV